MEVRKAERSIGVDLQGPCPRGHLPPMADYQELCRDLGHEKTAGTITLDGRDISNKIAISSDRAGEGWKEMERKGFSLSLSLWEASGNARQSHSRRVYLGFFFPPLRLSALLRSKSPLILELRKWRDLQNRLTLFIS